MSVLSTFLFARPSFIEGFARVLDVGNVLNEYNRSLTGQQADFLALHSDWRAIGQNIRDAGLAECHELLAKEGKNVKPARK
jgi:hypothetical protein